MRISVESAPHQIAPKDEAPQGLRVGAPLRLGALTRLVERYPLRPGGGEHPMCRKGVKHIRDMDTRFSFVQSGKRSLIGRFVVIVELLTKMPNDFVEDRPGFEPFRSGERHDAFQHTDVLQVGFDRFGYTLVLNLDGDGSSVSESRAMDLPDRCTRDGCCVEFGEGLVQGSAQFSLDGVFYFGP